MVETKVSDDIKVIVDHTGLSLDHKFMPSATDGVFKA